MQVCTEKPVNLPTSVSEPSYCLVTLTSPIDELDARLLAELRDNPRLGLLEISRRLGVARGTVQARLAKLEQRGVVTGYGPEIDPRRPSRRSSRRRRCSRSTPSAGQRT